MKLREHLELDQQTGVIDVHVLDVLAEIESLLRDAREIQRQILRVRGVPKAQSPTQRRTSAQQIRKLARKMADEAVALSKICKELGRDSDALTEVAQAG